MQTHPTDSPAKKDFAFRETILLSREKKSNPANFRNVAVFSTLALLVRADRC
jgi:hypothetical protein